MVINYYNHNHFDHILKIRTVIFDKLLEVFAKNNIFNIDPTIF